jgi:hypothetical protein
MKSLEYVGLAIIHQPFVADDSFGKVLLVRKSEKVPSGATLTWGFPSSPLFDDSKSLKDCLASRTKLQTNLDVDILFPIYDWLHPDQDLTDEKEHIIHRTHVHYYSAQPRYWPQKIILQEEKILEAEWVNPADVIKKFTTKYASQVRDYLQQLKIEPKQVDQAAGNG